MGSFRSIFFAITSIFSLTYCDETSFGINVPLWLNSLTSLTTELFNASPRSLSDYGSDLKDNSLIENFSKMCRDVFGYMATLLGAISRRTTLMRPNVELAPGVVKSEILKYPENYFVNRLKTLLKIKQREENMNKPVN